MKRRLFAVVLDTTVEKARAWQQAQLLIDAASPTPAGEGVGLLEPVSVTEPEPEDEEAPVEVPGVHEADDPRLGVEAGIIAVIVVGVLALLGVVLSVRAYARPRRRPTGRGSRGNRSPA